MSRWVTVHGTAEAEISNNIGFMTFGSGFFVEDGVELYNVFDHNLGAYAIPAVQSDYLNPTPIYPNVSSDFAQMSVFWLKNNGNVMARNVAACCPAPVIGFWMVPQPIANLRGPASLVLGSEPLQLPGLQSMGNALGSGAQQELSQSGNNNRQGQLPSVAGNSTKTACWVPDDFEFALAQTKSTRCIANTTDNAEVPYYGFMENVAYAIFMFVGEMPEMLRAGGMKYDLKCGGCIGVGSQLQDNRPRAQWMPVNGQNACTDNIISIYAETRWSPDLPYQPLTPDEITQGSDATWDEVLPKGTTGALAIPKILSGSLAFCLSPALNLWGGVAWLKQMAVWNINCAFIDTADDNSRWGRLSFPQSGNNQAVLFPTNYSTLFFQYSGGENKPYNGVFPVAHNYITNGYVSFPPNPSLWSGEKSFYDDKCVYLYDAEKYNSDSRSGVNKVFCDFTPLTMADVLPQQFHFGANTSAPGFPGVYFYDLPSSQLATVNMHDGTWTTQSKALTGGNQAKFPFICKDDRLRLASDGQQPEFNSKFGLGDVASNLVTGHFFTSGAKDVGARVCKGLYQIPANLQPQGF